MTFKLEEKPGKQPYYVWKTDVEHYYRHCDIHKVFMEAVNLFLNICNEKELSLLMDGNHFLRVNLYDDNVACRIAATPLDMAGLIDRKYEVVMRSLPKDQIPCELLFGPYCHLFGLHKLMVKQRQIRPYVIMPISLFFTEIAKLKIPKSGEMYFAEDSAGFIGMTLYARDAYASETDEAKIRETERIERIIIHRR